MVSQVTSLINLYDKVVSKLNKGKDDNDDSSKIFDIENIR